MGHHWEEQKARHGQEEENHEEKGEEKGELQRWECYVVFFLRCRRRGHRRENVCDRNVRQPLRDL